MTIFICFYLLLRFLVFNLIISLRLFCLKIFISLNFFETSSKSTNLSLVLKSEPTNVLIDFNLKASNTPEETDLEDVTKLLDKLDKGESLTDENRESLDRLKDRYPELFEESDTDSNDALRQTLVDLSNWIHDDVIPYKNIHTEDGQSNQDNQDGEDGEDSEDSEDGKDGEDSEDGEDAEDDVESDDSSVTIVPGRNYPLRALNNTYDNLPKVIFNESNKNDKPNLDYEYNNKDGFNFGEDFDELLGNLLLLGLINYPFLLTLIVFFLFFFFNKK